MMIPVLPVLRDPATIGNDRRRLHIRLKVQRTFPTMWASWARHV